MCVCGHVRVNEELFAPATASLHVCLVRVCVACIVCLFWCFVGEPQVQAPAVRLVHLIRLEAHARTPRTLDTLSVHADSMQDGSHVRDAARATAATSFCERESTQVM